MRARHDTKHTIEHDAVESKVDQNTGMGRASGCRWVMSRIRMRWGWDCQSVDATLPVNSTENRSHSSKWLFSVARQPIWSDHFLWTCWTWCVVVWVGWTEMVPWASDTLVDWWSDQDSTDDGTQRNRINRRTHVVCYEPIVCWWNIVIVSEYDPIPFECAWDEMRGHPICHTDQLPNSDPTHSIQSNPNPLQFNANQMNQAQEELKGLEIVLSKSGIWTLSMHMYMNRGDVNGWDMRCEEWRWKEDFGVNKSSRIQWRNTRWMEKWKRVSIAMTRRDSKMENEGKIWNKEEEVNWDSGGSGKKEATLILP